MDESVLQIKNNFEKKLRQILSLPEVAVIDFKNVGYPFYRISLNVMIRENRKLNLIEEFILKTIQSGLENLEDIAYFLGFEQYILDEIINNLCSQQLIRRKYESEEAKDDFKLTLTEQGKQCLKVEIIKETIDDSICILIDGLNGRIYAPQNFNFNHGKNCDYKLK